MTDKFCKPSELVLALGRFTCCWGYGNFLTVSFGVELMGIRTSNRWALRFFVLHARCDTGHRFLLLFLCQMSGTTFTHLHCQKKNQQILSREEHSFQPEILTKNIVPAVSHQWHTVAFVTKFFSSSFAGCSERPALLRGQNRKKIVGRVEFIKK